MKFDTQAFPYPILTPVDQGDDYIDGSFECVLDFPAEVNEDGMFSIAYINMLSVDEILDLIEEGHANFVIEITCTETLFRKVLKLDSKGKIELNAYDFHGKVSFSPMIVVSKGVDSFSSIDMNSEYGGKTFQIKPGDILALDHQVVKNVDFVKLSLETLVRIRTDETLDPYIYSIDPTPHFLFISMGEKLRETWTSLSQTSSSEPIFAISLFKDCLVLAIEEIILNEEAHEYKWARALLSRLAEKEIALPTEFDFNEVNRMAQSLIEHVGISKVTNLGEISCK